MTYIKGIDVSAYDPFIDWQKVKAQDIRFAIIKSTEGTAYFSDKFDEQWAGAKSVGIVRGSYHYLRAQMDGAAQADFFLSKVNIQDGDLPPFLDIEEVFNQNATNSEYIGNAKKWLDRVEQKTGRRPLVYSRASFLTSKMTINGKAPAWAKNYNTWIAHYFFSYSAESGAKPAEAPGWGGWIFWQYSGDHDTLDGIYRDASKTSLVKVDLNVYRYSMEELYKLAKGTPPSDVTPASPPATPTTPSEPTTYTVKSGDTLESVASANKLTLSQLVKLNPQLLKVGEVLTLSVADTTSTGGDSSSTGGDDIPSAPPSTPPATPQVKHTVQRGETLYAIAIKYGTTVARIADANNITNINLIEVGQVLIIPS